MLLFVAYHTLDIPALSLLIDASILDFPRLTMRSTCLYSLIAFVKGVKNSAFDDLLILLLLILVVYTVAFHHDALPQCSAFDVHDAVPHEEVGTMSVRDSDGRKHILGNREVGTDWSFFYRGKTINFLGNNGEF